MAQHKIVLGIDFGSTAVRVLTMNLTNGRVPNTVEQSYSEGENVVFLSTENSLLARKKAADYVNSMKQVLKKEKLKNKAFGIERTKIEMFGVLKDLIQIKNKNS